MKKQSRWFGTKAFYAMVLSVAVPIIIQNGITSFVNLLDNVMVGRIGTEQMSGVAIANQLIMIFDLGIFGSISGAGIFAAQFFGRGNLEGVRHTFRIKMAAAVLIAGIAILVFLLFGESLIYRFLQGSEDVGDRDATAAFSMRYLRIILISFIPFAVTQVYASTLKETSETVLPMKASIMAVLVNLVLNYVFIFGKLGLPALGCAGAAVATVISRFAEIAFILIGTHRNKKRFRFVEGLYASFYIPGKLLKTVLKKGLPLLLNELLWSAGMAILNQCYSIRGLSVVAALNITSTIANLFGIVMMALGNTVAILVGQALGSGDPERARDTDRKLLVFSVLATAVMGGLLVLCSPFIPRIYNTEAAVRALAAKLMTVAGCTMPINAFANATYFTLRSGGKTLITFLFDSAYTWVVTVPLAFCLVHLTSLPILSVYWIVQLSNLIKCGMGFIMVKKGIWINDIVSDQSSEPVFSAEQ